MNFDPSILSGFDTSHFKRGLHSRAEIELMCKMHVEELQVPKGEDGFCILMAICGQESSFGSEDVPRFEPSYSRRSFAWKRSQLLQDLHRAHGDLAAQSYGPFQIMAIKAVELGYPLSLSPINLWSPVVSLPFVIEYINGGYKYGTQSAMDIFAQYNAGWGCLKKPSLIPQNYLKTIMPIYHDLRSILSRS